MIEIIRDPIWQFIGVILAVVAIIITVIFFLYQRQKKAISWQIISNTPLLKIDDDIKRNLQVLYSGKPVQDIQLIIARIINTGNVSIKSTDYEGPINLNFGKNAQILTAEITKTSPNNLKASANIEGNGVIIPPTLMNSRDWITLKILVSQFDEPITVEGRIVGVKEIEENTDLYKTRFTIVNKIIIDTIVVIAFLLVIWIVESLMNLIIQNP